MYACMGACVRMNIVQARKIINAKFRSLHACTSYVYSLNVVNMYARTHAKFVRSKVFRKESLGWHNSSSTTTASIYEYYQQAYIASYPATFSSGFEVASGWKYQLSS